MRLDECRRSRSSRVVTAGLLGGVTLAVLPAVASGAPALPALPQSYIDTTYLAPTGKTITVNSGDNLQTALNDAQLGDTIVVQAGATFRGPFTLPNKTSGSGWIYVRSSAYAILPPPGTRVTPGDAANMPKITVAGGAGAAVQTVSNAHHYRFVGVEFYPISGSDITYNLITVGGGDTSTSTMPHDITFDRCFIHGHATEGTRRGVEMDGINVAVIDSYVSAFKEVGADSQALWVNNTPGPIKIVNNYLEGAGENVMLGGAAVAVANLNPADIEIRRNHFFKPLSWMGSSWQVKNLLEFKSGKRVLVEGNTFENNWLAAQVGLSLLITPRTTGGQNMWVTTEDITIRLNQFVNLGSGFNIAGNDDSVAGIRTHRVLIENNVVQVTSLGGADGRGMQIVGSPTDLTVNHNTLVMTGNSAAFSENTPPADQAAFTNNLWANGRYGFLGSGSADGLGTLNAHFTNWSFVKNALVGGYSANYAGLGCYFPASTEAVGFVNFAGGNYRLGPSSLYKNQGTDGKDLGADLDAIAAAMAAASAGGSDSGVSDAGSPPSGDAASDGSPIAPGSSPSAGGGESGSCSAGGVGEGGASVPGLLLVVLGALGRRLRRRWHDPAP